MQQFGRELRQAAQAAQQTGDTTQVDRLAASYEGARKQVAALGRQLRQTNTEVAATNRSFAEMSQHASNLGSALRTMERRFVGFAVAVGAAAVAMAKLASSSAKSLDNLDDTASSTGTTTQQVEKLQLAAAKAGDQGFESINRALERTTKAMGEAKIEALKLEGTVWFGGTKQDFSDPFKAVGLDPANFKDSLTLMEAWAKRLDSITDPTIRAAIAAALLGRNWARVLPTLKDLRAEMAQAERDIVAGGGFTSKQSIEAAAQYQAALGKLELQFTRLRDAAGAQLGAALIPALNALSAWVGAKMPQISAFIVNAAGYLKALTNDLIRFFVLGQPGQQTEWGATIINTILYLKNDLIPGLVTAFNGVMSVLNQVAGGINAVFGTNLTGGQIGIALAIGQVTGAFNTLGIAVTAIATVFGTVLLPLLGPTGLLVVGMAAVGAAVGALAAKWQPLADAINAAVKAIGDSLNWLWEKTKAVGSALGNIGSAAGSVPGGMGRPMATGGLVPGRGNRDTFPARLMPGEFVIRKSIVSALGADFFAGLNRGMGSLVPHSRYAAGGLVTAEPAGGGTPVHLHIGGGSFPLNGAPAVVSALVVEAHRQQIRSAGVKPSWYGGR